MFRRTPTLFLALLGILGLVGASFAPAVAALPKYNYVAYSGGSLIRALGTTISSDLTAMSAISGAAVPNSSTNQVAVVDAAPLARLGVIETSTRAAEFGDGVRITSKARTAGVNLLDGLLTADAVETTNITTGNPATGITATANTRFVNLKVLGVQLPVDIPQNYKITVPGVAVIGLNVAITQEDDGVVQSTGYGLGIWLLQSQATAPAGSSIILNPTYAGMAPPVPVDQPQVGGFAYGTQVLVKAGSGITGQVGKTANVGTPPGGTGGRTSTNSTATVQVPKVLRIEAITSTTTSLAQPGSADVTNTNEVVGVNLFDGLITADAINVRAHSKKVNGTLTRDTKLEFVNLVVAGTEIPIDVGPNTTVDVAGLGQVVINDQYQTFNANRIRGIYVKVLEPRDGIEVGAEIEVAVAATWITQPQ
ncbi:MAG: choice-of-anchor P family protein [Nocardioides sp.]|nr:choice-of-anchor P family protein [Nocardioides sp.]